jgi:hypothetical protein
LTPAEKPVYLRLTITPYRGQAVIFGLVTVFSVGVAAVKQEWGLLVVGGVPWLFFALQIFLFGLRYRVLWNDDGVIMRATGGPERRIPFDEISSIRYETAGPSERAAQSRPFRRIVIHGRKYARNAFIDVSLRHFRIEDIQKLLAAILARRPDLELPMIPYINPRNVS